MSEIERGSEQPSVYQAMLERPGGDAIDQTHDFIKPQYSGLGFVQFHYPTGSYSGQADWSWHVGVVRKPFKNDFCRFSESTTGTRTVSEGEVILIAPGEEYSAQISTPGEIDFLLITQDRFEQALQAHHRDDIASRLSLDAYFSSPLIASLLHTLLGSATRPGHFDPHHADNFVNAIVSELSRTSSNASGEAAGFGKGLSTHELKKIDECIDAEGDKTVTNAELASVLDLPEHLFVRAFKASIGETPYQYVLKRRVERAKTMLQMTNMSISQIAFSTGFSSQSHMTDIFRTRVGVTPAALRKSVSRN